SSTTDTKLGILSASLLMIMAAIQQKSKRPSDTSKARKLRRLLKYTTFFVDRSLESKCLLNELRLVGAKVKPHKKYYKPNAPDVLWLVEAGQKRWIILTKDKRIARNTLERLAILNTNGRAFVLTAGNLKGQVEAQILVGALADMLWQVLCRPAPFLIKIQPRGRV